jgi:gluconokinase
LAASAKDRKRRGGSELARRNAGLQIHPMNIPGLRSPHDKVSGLVYFGRMLDKIRLHQQGELHADFHANLGEGFDKSCASFLGLPYSDIAAQVKGGASDEETLAWCRKHGRQFTEEDAAVWGEFMRKRGWNDVASERLKQRKAESGLSSRDEIQTFFDYIDADEGRPVRPEV